MPAPYKIKNLLFRGSLWTSSSVLLGQLLRLGKSLLLSRLLFPEAYGYTTIVWSVLFILAMLSDIGLSAILVRHQRGDDEDFVNTIWTIKIVRGILLFVVACGCSYPLALFYGHPELAYLIPVAAITSIFEGFSSTKIYRAQRHMEYSRTTVFEISVELIGLIATISIAYLYPSVWALVIGALVASSFHAIGSHILLHGPNNKLAWDKETIHEVTTFGKWIFYSSLLYMVSIQGDRLLLGKYVEPKMLGIYSIALLLTEAAQNFTLKISSNVVFPALSKTAINERAALQKTYYRIRLGLDFFIVFPTAILLTLAPLVVNFLYDARYQEAGWIFRLLCIKLLMISIISSCEQCLIALGHPKYSTILNSFRAIWILVGMPLGWHFFGLPGLVAIVATTEIPVTVVLWSGMISHGILRPALELRSFLFASLGLAIGTISLYLF
jgi:O-antigen/teichoic acid export membrane protein